MSRPDQKVADLLAREHQIIEERSRWVREQLSSCPPAQDRFAAIIAETDYSKTRRGKPRRGRSNS